MVNQPIFRSMQWQDWHHIQILCAELGYPVAAELLKIQIKQILKHPDHQAVVCHIGEAMVGFAHLIRSIRLWSAPRVELAALVVAKPWRGRGIGKLFIAQARDWAGQESLRVRCSTRRKNAHKFYFSQGFCQQKNQKIFDLTFKQNVDRATSS